ncbi:MAG: Rv3654c family TadE-like protein [Actinomycetes bacterium]
MTRKADDAGAAIVWALVLTSVLLAMLMGAAVLTDVLVARERAGAAADLGALAAAPVVEMSSPQACVRAEVVVHANAAQMLKCIVVDGDVVIGAACTPHGAWARWLVLQATGTPQVAVSSRSGFR